MNRTEFLEKMVGRGRISQADVNAIAEIKADNDELVADFMQAYEAFKAGALDTNAKIGAEIKKVFNRQAKRDERAAAREATKAQRIADRKAKK